MFGCVTMRKAAKSCPLNRPQPAASGRRPHLNRKLGVNGRRLRPGSDPVEVFAELEARSFRSPAGAAAAASQVERVKVRAPIKGVHALGPLQSADYQIGKRRGGYLV